MNWSVAALYRFARVDDPHAMAMALKEKCAANDVCGTLILAHEGINGTIGAPSPAQLDAVLTDICRDFPGLELKFSQSAEKPFGRMKVKVKPEIVTMRTPEIDPTQIVGEYVEAKDWNALLDDPDVTVIDTRNSFEYAVGTFDRALDPGTEMFCDFPQFVEKALDPAKHKKIAMFCTGGIRCEKASSFMKAQGFESVYHLKGGILKYLETMPEEESRYKGRCFVFDERDSLGHGLKE